MQNDPHPSPCSTGDVPSLSFFWNTVRAVYMNYMPLPRHLHPDRCSARKQKPGGCKLRMVDGRSEACMYDRIRHH